MKRNLLFWGITILSSLLVIIVKAQPEPLPNPYTGTAYVARDLNKGTVTIINPYDYDDGGEGVAYHVDATRNGPVTSFRPDEKVSIDNPNNSGVWQTGWFHGGYYMRYTFNVPTGQEGTYKFFIKYNSGSVADRVNGDTLNIFVQFDKSSTLTDGRYQWFFNFTGAWYTGETYKGIDTSAGTINLTSGKHVLTLKNNCLWSSDPGDINFVQFKLVGPNANGIEEFNKNDLNVSVYPMPCTDNLNIAVDSKYKSTDVMITDITGKQKFSQNYTNTNLININTSDLSRGVYFITIKNNKGAATRKFIKM